MDQRHQPVQFFIWLTKLFRGQVTALPFVLECPLQVNPVDPVVLFGQLNPALKGKLYH